MISDAYLPISQISVEELVWWKRLAFFILWLAGVINSHFSVPSGARVGWGEPLTLQSPATFFVPHFKGEEIREREVGQPTRSENGPSASAL